MDRQYNDQKKHGQTIQDQTKHGQTIQRPKEAWTDNTTSKRNMDRQYNVKRKSKKDKQWCTKDRQHNGQKKKYKGQTMVYKALHRKLKMEQQEPH